MAPNVTYHLVDSSVFTCVEVSMFQFAGEEMPASLQLDRQQRTALESQVTSFVGTFLDELDDGPASYPPVDRALIDELLTPPADGPTDLEPLLKTVLTAARTGFDTASGGHLSFIPNGGLISSALARYIAAALNRWTGGTVAHPGAVALEQSVINWMCGLFSLGPDSGGVLTSGGSMATLSATIAARTTMGERFDDATVYVSEQAHHSVAKACRLAGIPARNVRVIASEAGLRMDVATLAATIGHDRRDGLRPMMVVATAGTTDTGTIDPLHACADIAAESDAWFHVDAAYGGFFMLTDRGATRLEGIERADSITVDAHKSLLLPYGVGGLFVADRRRLIESNEGAGAYLQDIVDDPDLPHFFAMGPELTRPYRGLDVWLPLHLHGIDAFRFELDRMLDLAENAARDLAALPGIEVVAQPDLSIVGFRALAGDQASAAIAERLNASREVHVSTTTIGGRYIVRLAFLNHRTTSAIAERVVELVAEMPVEA